MTAEATLDDVIDYVWQQLLAAELYSVEEFNLNNSFNQLVQIRADQQNSN